MLLKQLNEENEKVGEIDVEIPNFIFKDWNVYYNLYNPENFEDPENSPEWYDESDVYEYYEEPCSNAETITFYASEKVGDFETIEAFVKESVNIEKKVLDAVVDYTFGNNGAYAAAKHFEYAKRTMEILHQTTFSNEEFIKRNLCINTICVGQEDDELELLFDCSWNEEHGLTVYLKNNDVVSLE